MQSRVKTDFIPNIPKSFPVHLCAGSNPKVINRSSVVTTDISMLQPPPKLVHSLLNRWDTKLPSYHQSIVTGQEPLHQIRGR